MIRKIFLTIASIELLIHSFIHSINALVDVNCVPNLIIWLFSNWITGKLIQIEIDFNHNQVKLGQLMTLISSQLQSSAIFAHFLIQIHFLTRERYEKS